MKPEQGLINQIAIWLLTRGRRSLRDSKGELLDVITAIAHNFPFFEDGELERVFVDKQSRVDLWERRKYIILEPIPKEGTLIPILTFMYNFERNNNEARFRIGLFFPNKSKVIEAIGFRFESPEGDSGNHSFFHAQFLAAFNKQKMLPISGVLPLHQPSISLNARTPIDLFVCLLVSLYGKNYLRELQTADFWNALKPQLTNFLLTLS